MPRYWECPSCRALLTRERLEATKGDCPYCDARVGAASDFADPNASPTEPSVGEVRFAPFVVPPTPLGKVGAAFRLFAEQLPLLAMLVLVIKLPSNVAIELIAARDDAPESTLAIFGLRVFMDFLFSPVSIGGVLIVLAERMRGRLITFQNAARFGVDHWWRIIAARLLAGLVIAAASIGVLIPLEPAGIRLLFAIPGIILGLQFCLIDSIVALEPTPILDSRRRSAELMMGRVLPLISAALLTFTGFVVVTTLVIDAAKESGALDDPIVRSLFGSLFDVLAIVLTILLFLFYWEARTERESGPAYKPALEEHEHSV